MLVLNTLGGRVDSALRYRRADPRTSKVPTTAFVEGQSRIGRDVHRAERPADRHAAGQHDRRRRGRGRKRDAHRQPEDDFLLDRGDEVGGLLNGRDPDIAAAMVNPSLVVELKELGRTKEKGDVLTLSAQDAVKAGYAEYTASYRGGCAGRLEA